MKNNREFLRSIPVFAAVNDDALQSLSALLREEKFKKDQYIIREGDYSKVMYILCSGEVEVRKVISRESNKYKTLAILETGDIFGEMSGFGGEVRSADVVAREDSMLLKVDYDDLFSLIEKDAVTGVRLLQVITMILIARIKSLNTELTTLYEIGRLIPAINDTQSLTATVFEQVINRIEPAKLGFISVWNKFNDEFDIYRSLNIDAVQSIEKNDPISVWLLDNKTTLLVRDIAENSVFDGKFYSAKSFIVSPFLHDSEVLGFIFLGNPHREKAFTYSHMILLSTVCSQVAARLRDIEVKTEDIHRQRLTRVKF